MDVLSKTKNRKLGHHFKKKFLIASIALVTLSTIGASSIASATTVKKSTLAADAERFGKDVTVLRGTSFHLWIFKHYSNYDKNNLMIELINL
ncbi:hypothetical protein [Lactobacillus sp. PSON]|uniref:hypothetical protein n=1 Tax=Lactobacillus sp. PSON TaxID=3455454 RepID=UPI00404110FE